VPVVLDGEVCSSRELGGNDGPAVRSNCNQRKIRLKVFRAQINI
jgi:hypothetical protein